MKEMIDYVFMSLRRRSVRIWIAVMASALVCSLLFLMPGGVEQSTVLNAAQLDGSGNNQAQEYGLILKAKGSAESIPAPVLETNAEINVTGVILRGKVSQKFYNSSDRWVEGVYVFPLPENAAVDYMKMIIGKRIIEGQIKERGEAKRTYEAAKQEGKKASLVEQERQNIFTVSAANIAPFEEISISIEYQQEIRYADGKFGFRFPMVIGPRYIPGEPTGSEPEGTGWVDDTDAVPDASRITPPVIHPSKGKINPVSITVNLNAGIKLSDIKSLYHEIEIDEKGDAKYRINLKEGVTPADKDFALEWAPEPNDSPRTVLFSEEKDDARYLLFMVVPPDVKAAESGRIAREVIFIIDTSGSMDGTSIIQAKKALLRAVDNLHSQDKFNIIEFNNVTRKFFSSNLQATNDNLVRAKRMIEQLRASGGTEMLPALRAAFGCEMEPGMLHQVIFITDGNVGNENELFSYIKTNLGERRLFTIGIGSAPNSYFMTKSAEFGRGTYTFIGNVAEVEEKMAELFSKIESPCVKDIAIGWQDAEVQVFPKKIPDLYRGEPVTTAAMISAGAPDTITVSGSSGDRKWSIPIELDDIREGSGIAKLWAKRKINALMDEYAEAENKDSVKEEIVRTSLDFGLVSKFTSLVAVDVTPVRPEHEEVVTTAVPTNLPDGWNYESVFGPMPQCATPGTLYLIIGTVLFIICLVLKLAVIRIGR